MCNIIVLKPKQMPVRFEFDNMCWNNWHAFGLVTLIDGKLDIVKQFFPDGEKEIDSQIIWDLLQKDIDYTRILHVRHITAGTNSLQNTHPLEVFFDDKRHVVFAHNGTLQKFKSKKIDEKGFRVDDNEGPSDTKNFVDQIIQPMVSSDGDIHRPFVKKVLEEFWAYDNRGILISSDQEMVLLGNWKKRKDQNGDEYETANDLYFDTVKRGPEHARREASRKAKEEQTKSNTTTAKTTSGTYGTNTREVVPLSKYPDINRKREFRFDSPMCKILDDWSVYDRDGMATLSGMDHGEIGELLSLGDDSICLIDMLMCDYTQMHEELLVIEEKHEKATKKIAELVEELKKHKKEEREEAA